jgi:hypothetical protein
MPSSGMLRRVPLVRIDVSEDTVFPCCEIRLLVTANVRSPQIIVTLTMEALRSSDTSATSTPGLRPLLYTIHVLRVTEINRSFIMFKHAH